MPVPSAAYRAVRAGVDRARPHLVSCAVRGSVACLSVLLARVPRLGT